MLHIIYFSEKAEPGGGLSCPMLLGPTREAGTQSTNQNQTGKHTRCSSWEKDLKISIKTSFPSNSKEVLKKDQV